MKIKKGDKFLCIKDVIMRFLKEVVYNKGNVYISDEDGCITDNTGYTSQRWRGLGKIHFKPLKDVDKMYTKATDRLRELHRDFTGTKLGNTDEADYFDNKYMNHKDFSFSAQSRLEGFYDKYGYDYVSEEVFIELNGLEEKSYDEDPYNWVNNAMKKSVISNKKDEIVQNNEQKDVFYYVPKEERANLFVSSGNTFNPKPYYDNSKGSLYKVATERGWNAYLFDLVKRLERGGKKDPLKQEIEK